MRRTAMSRVYIEQFFFLQCNDRSVIKGMVQSVENGICFADGVC